MLYFAYGSNLNKAHMRVRCPGARSLGRFKLKDHKLVFRGVADCIKSPGDVIPGAVWLITPECEESLDRYEGIAGGHYRKEYLTVKSGIDGEDTMMYYAMNSTGIYPPSAGYLETILQGYRDHKLKSAPLREAVDASWDDKHPSHLERQRYKRNGRPRLAPKRKPSATAETTGTPKTGNLFGTQQESV